MTIRAKIARHASYIECYNAAIHQLSYCACQLGIKGTVRCLSLLLEYEPFEYMKRNKKVKQCII